MTAPALAQHAGVTFSEGAPPVCSACGARAYWSPTAERWHCASARAEAVTCTAPIKVAGAR
jgi:hypothetical protein